MGTLSSGRYIVVERRIERDITSRMIKPITRPRRGGGDKARLARVFKIKVINHTSFISYRLYGCSTGRGRFRSSSRLTQLCSEEYEHWSDDSILAVVKSIVTDHHDFISWGSPAVWPLRSHVSHKHAIIFILDMRK